MLESLFVYAAVKHRHRSAPLVDERVQYLGELAGHGIPHATLLRRADYCRHVAIELEKWPRRHDWSVEEIDTLAMTWAKTRVGDGRASNEHWPYANFRVVAMEFVTSLGRLVAGPTIPLARYEDELNDFVTHQQAAGWQSAATCIAGRWQVRQFLNYLEAHGVELTGVRVEHIDTYFAEVGQHWSRASLASTATILRTWFRYGEVRGWNPPELADAVLSPRLYRLEGLPLGPSWEQVNQMLAGSVGQTPLALRNRAIVMLLAVYGVRSSEVRSLRLEDLQWGCNQLRVQRAKNGAESRFPLTTEVGNAIASYLRHGRPSSSSRIVFLSVHAPFRALSSGAIYHLVRRMMRSVAAGRQRNLGPHALRHACACRLLESGHSIETVADHLGHRDPETTRIYAKANLTMLRRVALEDLGGLL